MLSVVNWQPTGGLMVQADRLGPKVGGYLVALWSFYSRKKLKPANPLSLISLRIVIRDWSIGGIRRIPTSDGF